MKRKISTIILAVTMILNSVPAYAANFHDINDAPWDGAKTYINKVADLGLMVGSEDEKGRKVFNPKESITFCETTQLVYSLLKITNNLSSSTSYITKWSSVMSSNKIPQWAYESVSYCLEEGFINISDLSSFMLSNGQNDYAKREDVARILGEALEDYETTGSNKSFNDSSSISANALEGVKKLASLGILSGDNNGNFNPKNKINRSEMAVVMSKAYDFIKNYSGTKTESGIVTNIEDFGTSVFLTVNLAGKSMGFYVDSSTIVKKGTTALSASDIGIYDTIKITYEGSDVDNIEITDDFQVEKPSDNNNTDQNDKISGEIQDLTTSRIKIKGEYYSFADEDDVDVEVDGKDKDLDYLVDLYDEDDFDYIDAEIKLDKDDYVIEVIAKVEEDDDKDDDDDGEYKGLLNDITSSKIEIGDDTFTLADEDDIEIEVDGDEEDLDYLVDLYDEDDFDYIYAEITVEDGEVVEIVAEVDDGGDIDFEGDLDDITSSRITIDDETYYFADEDDVEVEVDGDEEDLDYLVDLYDDDDFDSIYVEITLEEGEVVEVIADVKGGDSSDEEDDGEVDYLSASRIEIDGEEYDLSDDVDVSVEDGDETIKDIDDLIDAFDDSKLFDVTVQIEDDEVVEIEGEVIGIDECELFSVYSDGIRVSCDSGQYKYEVDEDCDIEIDGDSRSDLDDLESAIDDGDVTLELTIDDGVITEIIAEVD